MRTTINPRTRRAFVSALAASILVCAVTLRAADDPAGKGTAGTKVSLGVSVAYAWWNPVWGSISMTGDMLVYTLMNRYLKLEPSSRNYSIDPCPLTALCLRVDFNARWSLDARAEIGAYHRTWVGMRSMTTNPSGMFEYSTYAMKLTRYEGSLHAVFRIMEYCSFFFGPDYMGYGIREKSSNAYADNSLREQMNCLGVSAGFSFSIPLSAGLSLDPAVSGEFLYGFTTGRTGTTTRYYPWALGGKTLLPLVCRLEKLKMRCSVGLRYQFLYYFRVSNPDFLERWDHVYGPEISVSYSF